MDVFGFMELEQRLSEMFTPEIDYAGDAGEYASEGEDGDYEGSEDDDYEGSDDEYDDGDQDENGDEDEDEDDDELAANFEDGYYDASDNDNDDDDDGDGDGDGDSDD